MHVNLLEPVLNVVESALLSAVVDEDDAHGAFVVGLCDRAEAFLSRSVPNLQLHALVLHVDRFDLKVNSYNSKDHTR